jgi:hypothetical protein
MFFRSPTKKILAILYIFLHNYMLLLALRSYLLVFHCPDKIMGLQSWKKFQKVQKNKNIFPSPTDEILPLFGSFLLGSMHIC